MFQRFSRQQEAMHFADSMNAEHRARAQVRSLTALAGPAHHRYARFAASVAQRMPLNATGVVRIQRRAVLCCAVRLRGAPFPPSRQRLGS